MTAGFDLSLIKDVLQIGASSTASKSWTKTSGTNLCASSNLSQTCTAKPQTKIRLKHNVIMQHYKGDVRVFGWKMRQKQTTYKFTDGTSKVERDDWKGYSSKGETKKGAAEANYIVRRNAACDAQKI